MFFDHVFVMTATYIYVYDHKLRPRSKLIVPVSSTALVESDFFIDKIGEEFKANFVFNGFQEVIIKFHNGLQRPVYDAYCSYCDVYRDRLYMCGGNQVIEGFIPKSIVRHKYQGFFVTDQIYMYRYMNGNTVFETCENNMFTNYTFPGKGTIISWQNQESPNTAMYIRNRTGTIFNFQLPSKL